MSHYIEKCKHGVVMGQCRCMGPKPTRIVECPPGHESMLDPSVLDPSPQPASDLPCPHGRANWRHCPHCLNLSVPAPSPVKSEERTAVVAFIREQARVASGIAASPQSAFHVVAAFLTDVAEKVERGEHRD